MDGNRRSGFRLPEAATPRLPASAAMMLDHLGLPGQARQVREAVDATTASGLLTPDLGGTASTEQVVAAVIDRLPVTARRGPRRAG
jgi:isocitrate/isopropylmalate dehydrogenase